MCGFSSFCESWWQWLLDLLNLRDLRMIASMIASTTTPSAVERNRFALQTVACTNLLGVGNTW